MKTLRLGSSRGSTLQVVLATLPLFVLMVFLLYRASRRPDAPCYMRDENLSEEALDEVYKACSRYIKISDMIIVFIIMGCVWLTMAVYVTFFVPRRHSLVYNYLKNGKSTVGDVFYEKRWWNYMADYGYLIVPRVDFGETRLFVHKKVRVYHNYTREQIGLLTLPGKLFSAQPRSDLEIDRDVFERDREKMRFLKWFFWIWALFSLFAPLYFIYIMREIASEENFYGHPDHYYKKTLTFYLVGAFVVAPLVAIVANFIKWHRYYKWMTEGGNSYEEGKRRSEKGVFYDDDSGEYEAPSVQSSKRSTVSSEMSEGMRQTVMKSNIPGLQHPPSMDSQDPRNVV